MNNNFFKGKTVTSSFEEALFNLQASDLGPSALDAVKFLAQSQWRPGTPVNPAKHPFKAAALFTKSDKADKRDYLGFIHTDGEFLEASDGNTLIRIRSDLPEGWHNPKGEPVPAPENAHWPDFSRVIPRDTGIQVWLDSAVIESLRMPDGGYTLASVFDLGEGRVACFNARMLDRMARIGDTKAEIHMDKDRTRMIVAKTDNLLYIVMGLNV